MMQKILKAEWPAPNNVSAFTTLRNTDIATLNLPMQPKRIKQVHGTEVVLAEEITEQTEADAVMTARPNLICAVRTADCLPILICNKQGTEVAAIHAGWRGLAKGVVAVTCEALTSSKQDCLAWIGPAIGPTGFEVGTDVLENFASHGWSEQVIKHGFQPHPVHPGKWFGNLVYLASATLQEQGFHADNIYSGGWCTYSDPERFCSYRRSNDNDRMIQMW